MKKIFIAAVMTVVALTANAQVWVGGELGFSTDKTSFDGNKLGTNTEFTLAPELGYSLNENWDVAVKLAYGYSENAAKSVMGLEAKGSTNAFAINPYVRYTFVKAGNFSAFVDGGIAYATVHVNGQEDNINGLGVAVNPGIAYAVSPKVSLVAHIGEVGYNHAWRDKLTNDAFNLKLTNAISFGAYVKF